MVVTRGSAARNWSLRDYVESDERSWLRCRVLGFLDTAYFDDVVIAKPRLAAGIELVAVRGPEVVGVCDVSSDGEVAVIETIAVHPDHRRQGIASAFVGEAVSRLRVEGILSIEAWTREDPDTIAWYVATGFSRTFRYLHVYASTPEEMHMATTTEPGLMARTGHFHAWEDEEASLRERFARVHGCNKFEMGLKQPDELKSQSLRTSG